MKKLISFPVLLLSFLLLFAFDRAVAHPGYSCSDPYTIYMDSTYIHLPLTDSITWLKFVATGKFVNVVVLDPSDNLNGRITIATLSNGCGSTVSLASANFFSGEDTVITLIDNNLTVGNTYIIKLTKPIRGINDASRYFYIAAFSNPLSPTQLQTPIEVHNTPHNFTNHCDTSGCGEIVSNGNFEVANYTCSSLNAESYPGIIVQYYWRNIYGNSDVSCWWATGVGGTYFNSCYPMSCGSGYSVPKNWGGCDVQDHSKVYGWSGPSYGYCGIDVDFLYLDNGSGGYVAGNYDREYLLQYLSNQMAAGVTYKVSFWVQLDSLSDGYITAGDMGLLFTSSQPFSSNNAWDNDQIDSATGLPAAPQITGVSSVTCPTCGCFPSFNTARTWVNITGFYTATGNEKFIEIGNFRKDSGHTTISSRLSANQCDYFVDDVSILPYLTVSASPSTLCGNSSPAILSASSGFHGYKWNTGATTRTITVNPFSTTTYTVIASSGGTCKSDTATVTVTVDPPLSVIILGGGNICSGTPVYALPSGGTSPYTYSWTPSGGTTANLSSLSNGSYTVTTTDFLGCSASTSTSFTINPNCCYMSCGSPLTIPSGKSSSLYTEADFTSNPCISISGPGTFTISGSFSITACDIAMGDSASIDVPSGAKLTIDSSRLYACGDMWRGIHVETGGTLYINGTSSTDPCIVEDAIKGIELEGTASIQYGLFNNNLYDIYADGSSGATPGLSLLSSKLTCQSDPSYSNNAYLKTPYLGDITNSGVYIKSIAYIHGSLTIGNYSSPSYRNTFSNMNYGVNANNSSFTVFNNLFENLAGNGNLCMAVFPNIYTNCPPPIGIAILANDTGADGPHYVGGNWYYATTRISDNTIQECYRGVDLTGYYYPVISHNEFYNTANAYSSPHIGAYPYGDHAIYLKDVSSLQITDDTITNFYTGIHINICGLTGVNSITPSSNVAYNQILATRGGTGFVNSGILVENLLTPSPAFLDSGEIWVPLYINNNSVAYAGSSCITLNHAIPTYPLVGIDSNSLQILASTSRTDGTQRSGIYLEGSQNFTVYNNAIGAPGTYTNNSPYGRADTSVIGLRSVLSNKAIYECNSIGRIGESIMFEGYNYPSNIYYNYMDTAYNGLVLESSGIIGTQGNATMPIGDKWQGPFSSYYTYTLNSYTYYSPLHVLNNSIQDPTYSSPANNWTYSPYTGDYYAYDTTVFHATGTIPSCPSGCTNCRTIHGPQYRSLAQKVVDDSVHYSVFIGESEYIGQQTVFTQISEDTTLMDSSTILHNFYHTTTSSTAPNNISKLYTINADIAGKDYTAAESLNNSFTPVNLIEQNQQLVNYVYLHTIAEHIVTVNKSQYDTLANIAAQCPLEGGNAVFEARGMLNILLNTNYIITDSCMNDSSSSHAAHRRPTTANSSSILTSIQTKVYPNPANTLLNIEINLTQGQIAYFEMYNNTGEKIKDMELNNELTTLPTTNLPAGIYYYRITDNNRNVLKADKQLILH